MSEHTVRVFVSSPSDAMDERLRVEAIAERLSGEFERQVKISVVRWETSYYSAHETFQKQIPEASDCDVVISVFRARLGTALPSGFRKLPNGDAYPSGTAYEVLSAIEARQNGKPRPDVYVFRCAKSPVVELDDPAGPTIRADWERLKSFFDTWFRTPDGRFLAAFQNFTSADDFAVRVEDCLRQWLVRHELVEQGKAWDRTLKGSPFPGLVSYDAQLEDVFFGRYLDVVHALEHLRAAGKQGLPFLLLIGASDAGKSSLMRAGILPQLVRPGTVPEVDLWRKVLVLPGVDPLLSFATALLADGALGNELRQGSFANPEILAKLFLTADADASIAPIRAGLGRAAAVRAAEMNFEGLRPARLAIAIDQAERLLFETDPAVAEIFAKILAGLVKNNLAYVIVALRSNAYPRFQGVEAFRELRIKGVIFDVVQPGRAELEDIVKRPVAACRPALAFEVKDGLSLADTLVSDASGADELPLLQMALSRLFKAEAARGDSVLRFADYPGLGEAVSETAQDALMTLDEEAQAELTALIFALVSDVSTEPGSDALIPTVAAFEREAFERGKTARAKLVDAFMAQKLLVTEGSGQTRRVRAAHEALLRIWPEAVKIIKTNLAPIKVRQVLRPILREWAAAPDSAKAGYSALPPALLAGARQLMEVRGDDLDADMRAFIMHALDLDAARNAKELEQRADHERAQAAEALAAADTQLFRRSIVGLVVVAVLAVAVGILWREAQYQRELAESRLSLAVTASNNLVSDLASKFRNTVGVPTNLIEDILEQVTKFQEQLGEVTPALLDSKADAQSELATTMITLGNTKGALDRAREAQDIYQGLLRSVPNNTGYARGLSWSDRQVGDVLMVRGDLKGASVAYDQSRSITRGLYEKDKANADWQHDLTLIDNKIGDLLVLQDNVPEARRVYQSSLEIAQVPLTKGTDNGRWNSDLAWSYVKIGDADFLQKSFEDALAEYRKALKIRQDLVATNKNNSLWQQDVWSSDNKFGDALKAVGALDRAYDAYEDGRHIIESLANADAANTDWHYKLSISYRYIGDALRALKRDDEARAAYQHSLAISDDLAKRDADNAEWKLEQIRANLALAEMGDNAAARLNGVIATLAVLNSEDQQVSALIKRAKGDRDEAHN